MKVMIFTVVILASIGAGLLAGHHVPEIAHHIKQKWQKAEHFYITTDQALLGRFADKQIISLGWSQLLPEYEKQLLTQYLPNNSIGLTEQITRSIEASVNEDYKSAMYSTNIVESMLGKEVSISGFIVPIDVNTERKIQSFFLVPYFGACIHYPPPPPNQMIYVRTSPDFPLPDIQQAYTLTGVLSDGLYEDLLGTSAYHLEVVRVDTFYDSPDDFRQH